MKKDFTETSQVESRIEDVYATRSFVIDISASGNANLTGLSFKQPILSGINEAQCPYGRKKHPVPAPNCTCGFYCYDEPNVKIWAGANYYEPSGLLVDAIVRVSGRIAVHSVGLRAQNMEVVALAPSARSSITTYKLRKFFPETPVFSSIQSALHEFPIASMTRNETNPSARERINSIGRGLLDMIVAVALVVGFPALIVRTITHINELEIGAPYLLVWVISMGATLMMVGGFMRRLIGAVLQCQGAFFVINGFCVIAASVLGITARVIATSLNAPDKLLDTFALAVMIGTIVSLLLLSGAGLLMSFFGLLLRSSANHFSLKFIPDHSELPPKRYRRPNSTVSPEWNIDR